MMRKYIDPSAWVEHAISSLEYFERTYSSTYVKREREYYALFEISCFINIVHVYKRKGFSIEAINLKDGVFKYLTTPNGNPENFSYIVMRKEGKSYQLRQQVRIVCSKDKRIYLTPDIVVIRGDADILIKKDPLYANGSRRFFYVDSTMTVAAHECKSLEPFPELFASFVGMFMLAHDWNRQKVKKDKDYMHLAPSLFIGGKSRGFLLQMIAGYEERYPINIVDNIYSGFCSLEYKNYIDV